MGIVSSVICLFAIFAKKSLLAMDCRVKPGNDGCPSSRHMRRYCEPFPVLLRPAIGVAPVRLLSVRRGVTERRMDDGEVAHDADLYIMRLQILDRHRLRGATPRIGKPHRYTRPPKHRPLSSDQRADRKQVLRLIPQNTKKT